MKNQTVVMHRRFLSILLALSLLVSCQDDEKHQAEIVREQKKMEAVFSAVNSAWNFNAAPSNPTSASLLTRWNEWRILLAELNQKPKSTIGAFRNKAKLLSVKSKDLQLSIPAQFDRPEIRSRISVLQTKINSLNLFINLDEIPEKKVVTLIKDINTDLAALQMQMGEIVRRSQIPREEGETDMLRMLDTARAIPNTPQTPSPAPPEKKQEMMRRAKALNPMMK